MRITPQNLTFQYPENRTTYAVYAVLMLVLAVVTFENLAEYTFWDGWDDRAIMSDLKIMSQDPSYMFSPEQHHKDVRPPVDILFLLGYILWQDQAVGFRLLQISLHLFASLLLVYTFRNLHVDLELSLLSGLLFLVNTAHFRALHWITSINYILAFIFSLAVIISYNRFLKSHGKPWLASALLGLAIFSHPCAVTSGLFCIYLTYQKEPSRKQTLATSWPIVVATLIFPILAYLASPTTAQNEGVLSEPDLTRLLQNPFWYLGRLITSAHWIYREATVNHFQTWEMVIGLVAGIGLIIVYHRRIFPASDWAVWIFLAILPFLNNASERMAVGPSRHLYFASAGSSLIVAWGLRILVGGSTTKFFQAKRAVFSCVILLLIVSSILSVKRAEALSIYLAGRGYAYRSLDRPEDRKRASQLFEQAFSHAPNLVPFDIYLRMVHAGFVYGKSYAQHIDSALEQYPDHPQLHMLRGVTAYLQTNLQAQQQGETHLQKALDKTPNKMQMERNIAVAFQNLAVYFLSQQDLSRAQLLYLKALQFYPDYPLALYNLGYILYVQKQDTEAIAAFRKVIQLDPNHKLAWRRLSETFLRQGQYDEVIRASQTAIQLDPKNRVLYDTLAQALNAQNRFAEAIPILHQALRLEPDNLETHLILAHTYTKTGNMEQAVQTYQNVLRIDPTHPIARAKRNALP